MALGEVNILVVKRLAPFAGTSSREHRALVGISERRAYLSAATSSK
jgi:hypothetical protein